MNNTNTKPMKTLKLGDTTYEIVDKYSRDTLDQKINKEHVEIAGSLSMGRKQNTSVGVNSTALGGAVTASGENSFAEGSGTMAHGKNQHVQGKYNVEDTENKYAHIVGNGTSVNNRSNAHTLDWTGNGWFAGKLSQNGIPENDKDLATVKLVDQCAYSPREITEAPITQNGMFVVNSTEVLSKGSAIYIINEEMISVGYYKCQYGSEGNIDDIYSLNDITYWSAGTQLLIHVIGLETATKVYIYFLDESNNIFADYYVLYVDKPTNVWGSKRFQPADLSSVLTKTNLTTYEPTRDYHPATKKYVDKISNNKVDKSDAEITGSLNMGRKANTAVGTDSVALGYNVTAKGDFSQSEGAETIASDECAHAEGTQTVADSYASHVEGVLNKSGCKAFTITAVDPVNFTYTLDSVEGLEINDIYSVHIAYSDGSSSQAENHGKITAINGNVVTVDAFYSVANKTFTTKASYLDNGLDTEQNTFRIIARPDVGTRKLGYAAHIEGKGNKGYLKASHAEGQDNISYGSYAHAEGTKNSAGYCAHAEGAENTASGFWSHAEGKGSNSSGNLAHAEGAGTTASGRGSHTEGNQTKAPGDYAHAEGGKTIASGPAAHAEGLSTEAGKYAHAEGNSTKATGVQSHAQGHKSVASGENAHAEGYETKGIGNCSHAEGQGTIAACNLQHVQGKYNIQDDASLNNGHGKYAHIVGGGKSHTDRRNIHTIDWDGNACFDGDVYVGSSEKGTGNVLAKKKDVDTSLEKKVDKNQAEITGSLSMGRKAGTTVGVSSTSLGTDNTVEAENSLAVGKNNTIESFAYCSGVIGENNIIDYNAHHNFLTGLDNTVNSSCWYNFISGLGNSVRTDHSFTIGNSNTNNGYAASVGGCNNKNYGSYSDIQGYNNTNSGSKIYIMGEGNKVCSGISNSIIVGLRNEVDLAGRCMLVTGAKNKISKEFGSVLSGQSNIVRSNNGAASGVYNRLYGHCGFVSGHSNAIGNEANPDDRENVKMCHAQNGYNRIENGNFSHIQGYNNIGQGECQDTMGRFNLPLGNEYAHVVGNGHAATSEEEELRSNCHTLDWNGNAWYQGSITSNGADYAEYFEWLDGNPDHEDRVGLLVTLDGEKVKLANADDEILGIVSGTAAVLGDNYECAWNGKYVTDDFGRIIYDNVEEFAEFSEVIVDEIANEETGETELVEHENKYTAPIGTFKHPRINPDYDPEQTYVNRADRPEWDMVGMLGKLYLRDDGTCEVNGYATVGTDGAATASQERTNIRILSRVSDNIVRVLLK